MVGQKDCVRSNAHLQQAATSELFDQEESAAKDTDEDNRLCELNEAVCRNLHFPSDILRVLIGMRAVSTVHMCRLGRSLVFVDACVGGASRFLIFLELRCR